MNIKRLLAGLFAMISLTSAVLAEIQPGQSIQIMVASVPNEEKSRIDGLYPVSEAGMINMPFIGLVRASGLRSEQLASSLEAHYKSAEIYSHPTFQVIDGQKPKDLVVVLGGFVRSPGPKPWTRDLTLWGAIQAAGGASEFGSMGRVKLTRNGKMVQYDVRKTQFQQIPLEPNDTIEIPQKTIWNQ